MSSRSRPAVAVAVAVALTAAPVAAAPTCPNERPDASDADNLGLCLVDASDARKADEPRSAAASYARAVSFARRIYDAGKRGASPAWFTDAGEQVVYVATRGCTLAPELDPADALAALDACIELLTGYLGDLETIAAGDSASAAAARVRLASLHPLRAALAPEPASTVPAAQPAPATPQPATTPPPPTATPPPPPAATAPTPAPTPRPRWRQTGLAVSAGTAVVSLAGIVAAAVLGRTAAREIEAAKANVMPLQLVCETDPIPASCDHRTSARRLYITSAVFLGMSLILTATFTGLLVHDRRARRLRPQPSVAPLRGGATLGVTLRF